MRRVNIEMAEKARLLGSLIEQNLSRDSNWIKAKTLIHIHHKDRWSREGSGELITYTNLWICGWSGAVKDHLLFRPDSADCHELRGHNWESLIVKEFSRPIPIESYRITTELQTGESGWPMCRTTLMTDPYEDGGTTELDLLIGHWWRNEKRDFLKQMWSDKMPNASRVAAEMALSIYT